MMKIIITLNNFRIIKRSMSDARGQRLIHVMFNFLMYKKQKDPSRVAHT